MKRLISLFFTIAIVISPVVAESTWEGTIAVSRYGELPDSGNYGASNSFAVDTKVTVKNLENGNETTVTIVSRLADPGIFLLISRDAGKTLGVSQGEIARVRASIAQRESAVTSLPDDLPYNPDPDVNPAASVSGFAERIEPPPAAREEAAAAMEPQEAVEAAASEEAAEVAEATEAAEAAEEERAAEAAEAAEEEPAVEVTEAAEPNHAAVAEAAEPDRTAVTETAEAAEAEEAAPPAEAAEAGPAVEVAEAAEEEAPPSINGVDVAAAPPEGLPPAAPVDEPAAPEDDVPVVLGLDAAPVIDQAERFVLLAEPDVPDTSELVETREPELEEALRISSLEEPGVAAAEETLGTIVPPEPAFEEKLVEEKPVEEKLVEQEEPVAEDTLVVTGLNEAKPAAETLSGISGGRDEPVVRLAGEEPPEISGLKTAQAAEPGTVPVAADAPEVEIKERLAAEEPELRYSLLNEPEEPVGDEEELAAVHEPSYESAAVALLDEPEGAGEEEVAGLEPREPVFVAEEEAPASLEDTLIVSNLKETAAPAEPAVAVAAKDAKEPAVEEEEIPVVVNGFAPPEFDPDRIEIVLEPAEPRPPEPRIAGADLLALAAAKEPELEIAAVTEPEVRPAVRKEEAAAVSKVEPEAVPVVEPAAEREKPAEKEAVTAVPSREPAEALEYTTELSPEAYFLQLAAFTEAKQAASLNADLSDTYPVTGYLAGSGDKPGYRVLVGPLNQDETGALLYRFRVRGFPDAFLRAGAVR